MDNSYKIVFNGTIQKGQQLAEVKHRLALLFKTDSAYIEKLFSRSTFVIKSKLSKQEALKYKQAIGQTGAMCSIEPEIRISQVIKSDQKIASASPPLRKEGNVFICRATIERQEVGVYKYVLWPFARLKNAAEYMFELIASMIWDELLGKLPNYSQLAQFLAFLIFSVASFLLVHIPEFSYKIVLIVGLLLWGFDRFLVKHHYFQTTLQEQITLKRQQDGRLLWRRKNPDGDSDSLSFAHDEIAEITLALEHTQGGAFQQVTGAMWKTYVTMHDGVALLLNEHAHTMQGVKYAQQIAQRLNTNAVFANSEGAGPFAAGPLKASISTLTFARKTGGSGNVSVQRNTKDIRISSVWTMQNLGRLIGEVFKRSAFLVFLLILEGVMMKYGTLLNWLLAPYLKIQAPDFILDLSFTGILSVFTPENDWKEWLKVGLMIALMLFQGVKMSRKTQVLIEKENSLLSIGKKRLASLNTSQLIPPLFIALPAPFILVMDQQHAVQLHNFQTEKDFRAFTAAVQKGIQDIRTS